MDIIIKAAYFKKIDEHEVGYTAQFVDTLSREKVLFELPVIFGSHTDTFLTVNRLDIIKVALVDGRIIALSAPSLNVELVKDIVNRDFSGREVNGNVNYIKETYGIREDILEATVLEALRDSYLRIHEMSVNDESTIGENGLILDFSSSENTTRLAFPENTELEKYILGIAGSEDLEEAKKKLLGRAFYIVDYALDVIGLVDKETKRVCILNLAYDKDGNLEHRKNLEKIEKLGITEESLDLRIKRLINKEESK